ncbi:calcium-transporting ATPase 9, plasma membrane-type-like [Rosa chinensis]|nr:calcium-transporting ATPase 9, plasma membrane-type-like [Rosa chinensis]
MLVMSVGSNTGWGLLMASISEDTGEEAPLQVHLNGLATFIGIIGLSVAALVLIILLIKYSARLEFDTDKTSFLKAVYGGVKIFTIAVSEVSGCLLGFMFYVGLFDNFRIIQVTILVVAVPECLPLVITLREVAATTFFLGCNNTGR